MLDSQPLHCCCLNERKAQPARGRVCCALKPVEGPRLNRRNRRRARLSKNSKPCAALPATLMPRPQISWGAGSREAVLRLRRFFLENDRTPRESAIRNPFWGPPRGPPNPPSFWAFADS
ncbi:unnamed protein product [Amoebophrya sp. A120]|nr:unnamed protein product [Amoebophrya sp. A120]|eukprot:GSA120T00021538001.1